MPTHKSRPRDEREAVAPLPKALEEREPEALDVGVAASLGGARLEGGEGGLAGEEANGKLAKRAVAEDEAGGAAGEAKSEGGRV